jgi:hypothetical protein
MRRACAPGSSGVTSDLGCRVVEILDADATGIEGEDPGGLTRGAPGAAAGRSPSPRSSRPVPGGRPRWRRPQLIVLDGDVHDRVRHQVHRCEGPGHASGPHVASGHKERGGTGLGGRRSAIGRARSMPSPRAEPEGHPPDAGRELYGLLARASPASRPVIGPRTDASKRAASASS